MQGIYKIIFPNGKCYIGQSCNLKRRLSDYKHLRCKKQPAVYKALLEFGVDSINIEIIEQFETTEDLTDILNELEIKYIKECNSLYPNGYNLNTGGHKFKYSEEAKAHARIGTFKGNWKHMRLFTDCLEIIDKTTGKIYKNGIEWYELNKTARNDDFYEVFWGIRLCFAERVPHIYGDYGPSSKEYLEFALDFYKKGLKLSIDHKFPKETIQNIENCITKLKEQLNSKIITN